MPNNLLDVFSDDAFSMVSLTDAINSIDHVPGLAGELAFAGVSQGIDTTEISIEMKNQSLSIIPTSPRGAPAPKETRERRTAIKIETPHIQLEDTVNAASVQNVRAFGTGALESVQGVVNEQMQKMTARMDLTLEHLRLGALKGRVLDADGTELVDLYATFGVSEPDPITFPSSSSETGSLRVACQNVSRQIFKAAKTLIPNGARVAALCGDDFFDQLVSHPDVASAFQGWSAAQQMLANNATATPFVFGDVAFINYRGTDGIDGEEASEGDLVGEVGIASGEARIFLTGVPGLYTEKFAPADFVETVNQVGLPRYAKLVLDPELGRWVKLHVQSNPLPLCTRPATLLKGAFG
jgi:hypothetical protein